MSRRLSSETPRKCLLKVDSQRNQLQPVYFCGVAVNLSAITAKVKVDHGYLSRIFAGKQRPGLRTAEKIAGALGMSVDGFLAGLRALEDDLQQTA